MNLLLSKILWWSYPSFYIWVIIITRIHMLIRYFKKQKKNYKITKKRTGGVLRQGLRKSIFVLAVVLINYIGFSNKWAFFH